MPGATYFFTIVTYQRRPMLTGDLARDVLHKAFQATIERYPFSLDAICLLPDHIHCMWTLPDHDGNFSLRWSFLKSLFTRQYREAGGVEGKVNLSREKRREAGIWQRRFWEHMIRDDADYQNHLNYIHYNPVRHGLVKRVKDWKWSSFHRFVCLGLYDLEWGSDGIINLPELCEDYDWRCVVRISTPYRTGRHVGCAWCAEAHPTGK